MKKIAVLALSAFLSSLIFVNAVAFAEDDARPGGHTGPATPPPSGGDPTTPADNRPDLKVYYNESIGNGEKVYQVTACNKQQSYAPLRCTTVRQGTRDVLIPELSDYSQQCISNGRPISGKIIEGCKTGQPISGTSYPAIDLNSAKNFNAAQCKDKPDDRSPMYVPEWAVVEKSGTGDAREDDTQWELKGMVSAPGLTVPASSSGFVTQFGTSSEAEPFYRPSICVTWDILSDGQTETMGTVSGNVQTLFDAVREYGQVLADAGCNNTNSGSSVSGDGFSLNPSTPYNTMPSLTCTTKYRIVGKTGADILSQYIGMLYKWAAGIVGVVSVFVMVLSGVQISMAGGDSAKIDSAKHRITQSIIGLVLLFLSGLILYTINPGFFVG